MRVELTNNNVKHLGRTMLFGDTLFLSLSGSGIEFNYRGKGFNITFVGGSATEVADNEANLARIRIYTNEKVYKDFLLDEKLKTVSIDDSLLGTGDNAIRIIKLSECAMSLIGIKPLDIADGESITPASDKKYKIESGTILFDNKDFPIPGIPPINIINIVLISDSIYFNLLNLKNKKWKN